MNPLLELRRLGQSVWIDYIQRSLVTSGELQRLVREDGIGGVTSNPTIFEKAIAGSADYDAQLAAELLASPGLETPSLFEALAMEDIRLAADVLREVFDRTGGADGYVSLEVPPSLASDTEGTVREARRLWQAIGRPNAMIKVPATPAGLPAVEELIAAGVNVNVTLMFSLDHYERVARAYIRGLERCARPDRVASVASFFVSRVDTVVDDRLGRLGTPEALALRGRTAVANCRVVYRRFLEIFHGAPFAALRARGGRVQRPLWASTSTKNPAYRDVVYVEELVGAETVNTVPPATITAFRDHGMARGGAIEDGVEQAREDLRHVARLGIDLDDVTEQLQADGVAAFGRSYDDLVTALAGKRARPVAAHAGVQSIQTGDVAGRVTARLAEWREQEVGRRIWEKDHTVWSPVAVPELSDRLGWLSSPREAAGLVADLSAFAEEVRQAGTRHVVLLGMGGSSLAPEVYQSTFGARPGFPSLIVLDSTHPAAVRAVEAQIDLDRTLFVVSSKSGTTSETTSFFRYFWSCYPPGRPAGPHFAAITDPGTPLEQLAMARGFRRAFLAPPDVGGRYSALTVFGLVPAALIGVDLDALVARALRMAEASGAGVTGASNPGLLLGAALGELAAAGRDKLTFLVAPPLESLPAWLEQLIAESTGKNGKGIVPVADEPALPVEAYGTDRVFVSMAVAGAGSPAALSRRVDALHAAGRPVVRIILDSPIDLGAEFFRWEFAVASAGSVLGIQPFDQPDVQVAKDLARRAMEGKSGSGDGAAPPPVTAGAAAWPQVLGAWLAAGRPGDYIGLQAYLAPTPETLAALQKLRLALALRSGLATTLGFGPRFLHSTGQLHKGGPSTGFFLQFVDAATPDLAVPEATYTFGQLIGAQAAGDAMALAQRGRRVVRIGLGTDAVATLDDLTAWIEELR